MGPKRNRGKGKGKNKEKKRPRLKFNFDSSSELSLLGSGSGANFFGRGSGTSFFDSGSGINLFGGSSSSLNLGGSSSALNSGSSSNKLSYQPGIQSGVELPVFKRSARGDSSETGLIYVSQLDSEGAMVEIPNGRYLLLYSFTNTKMHNKVSENKQGPHTLSHVFMDQLFGEGVTRIGLAKLFEVYVPPPESIEALLEYEGIKVKRGEAGKYERYLLYYAELYQAIRETFNYMGPNDEALNSSLIAMIRAILELNPYSGRSWKSGKPAGKNSLKGKGERAVEDLNKMSVKELKSHIDFGPGFKKNKAFVKYMVMRLMMGFGSERAGHVVKLLKGVFDSSLSEFIEESVDEMVERINNHEEPKKQRIRPKFTLKGASDVESEGKPDPDYEYMKKQLFGKKDKK